MKRGFTLLELIVVIIIIGILATLGIQQYSTTVEKSRTAEAKANLGSLRTLQLAYYQEQNAYGAIGDLDTNLPSDASATCTNNTFYFSYGCTSGTGAGAGTCSAYRCTAGGKTPNYTGTTYTISLDVDGTLSGDPFS